MKTRFLIGISLLAILPFAVCKTYAWEPGNQPPVAVVYPSSRIVNIYQPADFYGGYSHDYDGYIVGYLWVYCEWGCDHLIEHQILPNHHYMVKFDAPLTYPYTLELWVTDNDGAESTFPDYGTVFVRTPYVEIGNSSKFITTDTKLATLQNAWYGTPVTWSTQTLSHSGSGGGWAIATAQGNPLYANITFDNRDHPPGGRGYPLSYRIRATVEYSGYAYYADMTQDEVSQCRQEYIDMGKATTPTRGEFSSAGGSAHFSWAELNHSWNYYTNAKYLWIVIRDVLYTGLEATRTYLGNLPMYINSGYRSPMRNAVIGGAKNSRHIYGDAADVRVDDFNNDGNADYNDWLMLYNAAGQAGADYREPYNETGTWVHMDWRNH